jgi:hypothetical protein
MNIKIRNFVSNDAEEVHAVAMERCTAVTKLSRRNSKQGATYTVYFSR